VYRAKHDRWSKCWEPCGTREAKSQSGTDTQFTTTGELTEIERLTVSSEGGGWKSACRGNSLAAYPTARTVLEQRRGERFPRLL